MTPGPAESWRKRNRRWLVVVLVVPLVIALNLARVSFVYSLLIALAMGIILRLAFPLIDRLRSGVG